MENIKRIINGWLIGFDGEVTKEVVEEVIDLTSEAIGEHTYSTEDNILREELAILTEYLLILWLKKTKKLY